MCRGSMLFLAVVAGIGALTGCGGDDPMPPNRDLAPNLAGTYDLRAFTSALVTGGLTLEPPVVSGMFTLRQAVPTGSESMGTFELSITVPDGMGGNQSLVGQGRLHRPERRNLGAGRSRCRSTIPGQGHLHISERHLYGGGYGASAFRLDNSLAAPVAARWATQRDAPETPNVKKT